MLCESIEFCDFRNIGSGKIEFSDGINVLWGKNAQGKSNVLEAVYYFARGRSFRGARDRDMIMFGHDAARIQLSCRSESAKHTTRLEVAIPSDEKIKKKVYRNGAQLSGIGEMIGSFRAVLFCPAHLSLVNGVPGGRRAFLDIAISQLSKEYMDRLTDYRRVLLQRNAALRTAAKGGEIPPELWETYAEQMASSSAVIASYRFEYMSMLSQQMERHFREMTHGGETPSLSYTTHTVGKETKDPDEGGEIEAERVEGFGRTALSAEPLRAKLLSDIEREIKHGSTLWGVHKDDIKIKLNGRDAKLFASQGQMRSLALTMKLSEGELSYRIGGERPVILLDDVLSELDGDRRSFVLGALCDRQIIVTSCEPDLFGSAGAVDLFRVEGGAISRM